MHAECAITIACPATKVIPANPCTGVENWDNAASGGGCPGEAIWKTGADEIDKAKLPGGTTYGMAINPIGRRGHHQVR
jgi:hypothetical protein